MHHRSYDQHPGGLASQHSSQVTWPGDSASRGSAMREICIQGGLHSEGLHPGKGVYRALGRHPPPPELRKQWSTILLECFVALMTCCFVVSVLPCQWIVLILKAYILSWHNKSQQTSVQLQRTQPWHLVVYFLTSSWIKVILVCTYWLARVQLIQNKLLTVQGEEYVSTSSSENLVHNVTLAISG